MPYLDVLRVLSVLVLAGAVLLAPAAILACEIACATSEAAMMTMPMAGEGHRCHHVAPKDNGPVAAALHGCAHLDGLPTTFGDRNIAAALPPVTSVILAPSGIAVSRIAAWRTGARPPGRSPKPTPLRI